MKITRIIDRHLKHECLVVLKNDIGRQLTLGVCCYGSRKSQHFSQRKTRKTDRHWMRSRLNRSKDCNQNDVDITNQESH
jgi:hypothetical protein